MNAEITSLDQLKALELKRDHTVTSGGIWDYFERNYALDKIPAEALQVDSRINKVFFSLKDPDPRSFC